MDSHAALFSSKEQVLEVLDTLKTKHRWLQQAVLDSRVTVEEIPTEANSSDLGRSHFPSERSIMLQEFVDFFCARVSTTNPNESDGRFNRTTIVMG